MCMAIPAAHPREEVDRFELFEQVCTAAGVEPGAERLGILLDLPLETQRQILVAVAARMDERAEGANR
jgi:hypothetical protein